MKTCPDCAEEVQTAANVCKHCGHRFDIKPLPGYAKWIVAVAVAVLVLSLIYMDK